MKIRYKILLSLALIMITLTVSLYAAEQTILLNRVTDSENIRSSTNAIRFTSNLYLAISNINNTVNDWAKWDDTYFFAKDNNTAFIESNLMDDTFENLDLNMMLFFDQSGMLVYGKMYDLSNRTAIPFDESLIEQVKGYQSLFANNSANSNEGIIVLNGVPMIVAAHPILTSQQQGPAHGTLIMGRYLEQSQLSLLSLSTGLPVSLSFFNDNQASDDFELAKKYLSNNQPIYTKDLNETTVAAYVLLSDVEGKPGLIVRLDDNRTEYAQGITTLMYFGIFLIIIVAIMFLVITVLLDKLVLSRLSVLNNNVIHIMDTGDNSKRVKVQGRDELSSLSVNINGMLDAIDKHTSNLEKTVEERTKDLYKNQEALKSILLASPDAIAAIDLNGNITECNNQLAELYGSDRTALLGKSILSFVTQQSPQELFDKVTKLQKETGEIVRFEAVFIKGNGVLYPAELSVNSLKDEEGKLVGYVAIVRDLSVRESLEQRLSRSERLAAIGELAGMVGHDLRNPLSAIRNADYILKKKCAGCQKTHALQMFDIIDKSIDHSNNIINDLLDYSREISLEITECSPKRLLQDALLMVKVPKDVTVMDSTSDLKFDVDADKAVRVFVNLMKNAFDAMPNGGTLEVKSSQENDYVTITFSDTGIGMKQEALSKIFTPLFTTKAQGMGFGLSISKRIVDAHGGRISVQSTEGVGTTFTVVFPKTPKFTKEL